MKSIFVSSLLFSLIFSFTYSTLFISQAEAVFNKQINYQGKLTTSANVAVANGTYNMEFKLYTVPTVGTAIWTETRINTDKVQVTNGLFSVMLGEVTSLSGVDFNQTLYLGINIGGTAVTPTWDGEMTPRKKLGAVPAAVESERVGGFTPSQTPTGSNIPVLSGGALTMTGAIYSPTFDASSAVALNLGTTTQTALTLGRVGASTTINSNTWGVTSAGAFSGITTIGMSGQLTSTLATGTAPFAVTSTTLNTNLNADLLDGQDGSYYAPATGSSNYIQNQNASAQTANAWISGTLEANSLKSGNFDIHPAGNPIWNHLVTSDNGGIIASNGTINTDIGIAGYEFRNGTFKGYLKATTSILTNLTDGYIPYHISDASGLGDSPVYTNGTNVGIGNTSPTTHKLMINGSVQIGTGFNYTPSVTTDLTVGSGTQTSRFLFGQSNSAYGGMQWNYSATPSAGYMAIGLMNGDGNKGFTLFQSGNIGVGHNNPTALFHLKAGTATANTAPLKFTSGTNLTTAEAGAMEWDGTNLFITQTTGPTRKTIAYTTDLTSGYVPYTGATANVNLGAYNLTLPAGTVGTPGLKIGAGTAGVIGTGTNDIALVSNGINVATFVASSATDVRFQINTTNYSTMFGQYEGDWFGVTNPMIMQPLSPATAHDIAITGTQNSPTNGIVIKAGGNVGIGTTAPGAKLDVVTTNANVAYFDSSHANGPYIALRESGVDKFYIGKSSAVDGQTPVGYSLWSPTALKFFTNASATAKMVIQTDGNVGIGTTGPDSKLTVINESAATNSVVAGLNIGAMTTGTAAAGLGVAQMFTLEDAGGSGIWTNEISSTWVDASSANRYTRMDFWSSKNNTRSVAMSIDQDGKVGIGTTSPSALLSLQGNTPTALSGTLAVTNLSATVTGTTTAFTTELNAGDAIKISGVVYQVSSIASATSLTLTTVYAGVTASGLTGYKDATLFAINNGFGTNKLTVDKSGNVGIGATNPVAKLHISGGGITDSFGGGATLNANGLFMDNDEISTTAGTLYIGNSASSYKNVSLGLNFYLKSDGNVGIGTTSPTAVLHLKAGTAVASTAPLKFTSGTNLTTAEAGAMEYDGTNLYFTPSGTTRKTIAYTTDLTSGYVPYTGATGAVNIGSYSMTAGSYLFPVPTGDPSPVITARTVPAGQGASAEKTELILFHSNDNANGSGVDQITLRAPALSFQTYDNATVGSISDNNGYNERMYINPAGNVGIGTTTPGHNLAVYSASGTDMYLGHANNSGTFPKVSAIGLGSDAVSYGYANNGGTLTVTGGAQIAAIQSQSSGAETALAFYTTTGGNVQEKMRILNSGYVGIGTTGPGMKLDVNGSMAINPDVSGNYNEGLRINNAPNNYSIVHLGGTAGSSSGSGSGQWDMYKDPSGDFNINTQGNNAFKILAGGNVGIGTTGPSEKLSVSGSGLFTGNVSSKGIASTSIASFGLNSASYQYGLNNSPTWTILNGTYVNNNATAPDNTTTAGTYTLSATSYDMFQTIATTPGVSYKFGAWVKLGTATNFCVVINNTLAWNTVGGKCFTSADGLSTSDWTYVSYSFIGPATGSINLHIGAHSESGVSQQTAGTVYAWNWEIIKQNGGAIVSSFSGNVGIGATSPGSKLEIKDGTSSDQLRIGDGTSLYKIGRNVTDGLLDFQGTQTSFTGYNFKNSDGTSRLYIKSDGNVGIGTTAPGVGTKLNVNGRGLFTGGVVDPGDGTASGVSISYDGTQGIVAGIQTAVAYRDLRFSGKDLIFGADSVSATERMRIVGSTGNVGIGTTTPSATLHVGGLGNVNTYWTAGNNGLQIGYGTGSAEGLALWENTSTGATYIGSLYDNTAGTMNFVTHASSSTNKIVAMTIKDGNVGIGTATPYSTLNVAGNGTNLNGKGLIVGTIADSIATVVPLNSEVGRFEIGFPGWRDVEPYQIGAKIAGVRMNYFQNNNALVQATELAFYTGGGSNGGVTGSLIDTSAERMRIDKSGNVGIGTVTPGAKLEVQSTAGGVMAPTVLIGGNGGNASLTINSAGVNNYSYQTFAQGGVGKWEMGTTGDGNGNFYLNPNTQSGYGNSAFFIQRNGNVGIGNTSPGARLDIQGGDLRVGADATSNGLRYGINVYSYDNGGQQTGTLGADYADNMRTVHLSGSANTSQIKLDTSASNGNIVLYPGTGNVGIGTTSPATKLHVYNAVDGVFNGLAIDNRKTYGVGTGINETSKLILSLSEGVVPDPTSRIFGYMEAGTDGETSSADGWMALGTRTGSVATEKMRITSGGNVGIGTTGPAGRLNINETTGTVNGAAQGSLVIDHANSGGASSIVFRSAVNRGSDYGFIQYQDSTTVGGGGESAKLIIGTSNDTDDDIVISPSGNVGVKKDIPVETLDVVGSIGLTGSLKFSTAGFQFDQVASPASVTVKKGADSIMVFDEL